MAVNLYWNCSSKHNENGGRERACNHHLILTYKVPWKTQRDAQWWRHHAMLLCFVHTFTIHFVCKLKIIDCDTAFRKFSSCHRLTVESTYGARMSNNLARNAMYIASNWLKILFALNRLKMSASVCVYF